MGWGAEQANPGDNLRAGLPVRTTGSWEGVPGRNSKSRFQERLLAARWGFGGDKGWQGREAARVLVGEEGAWRRERNKGSVHGEGWPALPDGSRLCKGSV